MVAVGMVSFSWKADSAKGGVCGRDNGALEIEIFVCFLTMVGSGRGFGTVYVCGRCCGGVCCKVYYRYEVSGV